MQLAWVQGGVAHADIAGHRISGGVGERRRASPGRVAISVIHDGSVGRALGPYL